MNGMTTLPEEELKRRLRELPSVDGVLLEPEVVETAQQLHRRMAVWIARQYLNEVREGLMSGSDVRFERGELCRRLRLQVRPTLSRAINGLGVLLHTGLGRAPLCVSAQQALADVGGGFSSLEIDLDTGRRGSRYRHIEPLLCELSGAEAAMVVNNNCAATLLVLTALARGREVVVSRGQLIEIGGAFRIPDVMMQSGCRMVEVGTTNRTHLRDYRDAITGETAALLRVHTSNYRIVGFTREVGLADLVELARETGVLVIDDLGSGAFVDLSKYGLPKEPLVQDSVRVGADVVCFSGDKLIGGCQAGIIVGRKKWIDVLKRHPLTRALRCDKLTYSVLERTLELFLDEERLVSEHPLWRLLLKDRSQVQREARALLRRIRPKLVGVADIEIRSSLSEVGGGALAGESLPSLVVVIRPTSVSADELARRLRWHRPPVFCRVESGGLVIDLRTVSEDEIPVLAQALLGALGSV